MPAPRALSSLGTGTASPSASRGHPSGRLVMQGMPPSQPRQLFPVLPSITEGSAELVQGGRRRDGGSSRGQPCLHTQTRGCFCEQPGHATLGGAARLFRELSAPPREVSDAFIYKPAGSCPATSSSLAGKSPAEPRQTESAASLRGRRRCRPGQGCSRRNARPWGPEKAARRCPCPARGAAGPVPIRSPDSGAVAPALPAHVTDGDARGQDANPAGPAERPSSGGWR